MYKTIIFILLLSPASLLAGETSKYAGGYSGKSQFGFNSEIWQPKNFNAGVSGSISAKVSCTDIQVDFDVDAMTDKLANILHAIIGNPQVLVVNATIKGVARLWAVNQCGGSLEQILMEYPEQIQKLSACIQEGMGDSTSVSSGAAAGTASFVEFETETNPGVFTRISGCISGELGDEYGDGFRRCIDREATQNVNTIRDILDWSLKFDFENRQVAEQTCILDEKAKEDDFVKAANTYGDNVLPDGTKYNCDEEECKAEKVSWADFALTKEQDSEIKSSILDFIEEYHQETSLAESKKEMVYTFLLNWYEDAFINSNSWQTDKECSEIISTSDFDQVINDSSSGRLARYYPDPDRLFVLYSNDSVSLTETAQIMKESCSSYMSMIKERMFLTSAQKTLPAINSKVQRKTYELGFVKSEMDITLLNMADESRNMNLKAKERQKRKEKERFTREIKRAIEKVRGGK